MHMYMYMYVYVYMHVHVCVCRQSKVMLSFLFAPSIVKTAVSQSSLV